MSDAKPAGPAAARPLRPSARLRISHLLRPHWTALSLASIAILGVTLADILEPWPIKIILDHLLQAKPLPGWLGGPVARLFGTDKLAVLYFALAAVGVIAVVGAFSSYAEKSLTTKVGQWVAHDLRRTLHNHIQRLSLAEHDATRTGDLITRVTSDIDAIQEFLGSALLGIVVNFLTLLGMIGVMLYLNWSFTLIALSVAPVLFLVVFSFTRRIKKLSREQRKTQSELVSVVQEALTSVRVVQAFAREDYEEKRFESQSLENLEVALRARSLKALLAPVVEVIVAAGTCLVLGYGARLALANQISAGVLLVFLLYLGKMYKPMRELSKMTDTVSKAAVSYERIREVLEIESSIRDLPGARQAPMFKGKIEFDRVNFGYEGGAPVLTDLTFAIEPGQIAAFVGPSGTGKTTIASLISRFYDPVSGQVRIDGTDVRRYRLKSLREQLSFVLQETLLFHASVWQNISYGKPEATAAQIRRAAELANAHEFIERMPGGYDAMIGERGLSLSGGERQRIAIARAIIRDSPLLILDEPTTGLDTVAEHAVLDALHLLMKGKTCVLIAHNLASVRDADVIFVLQGTGIAERGTHETLLAAGGPYAEMCKLQAAGEGNRVIAPPAELPQAVS